MNDQRIKYKCSFQEDWLSIEEFKPWLRKVEGDKHSAMFYFPSLGTE